MGQRCSLKWTGGEVPQPAINGVPIALNEIVRLSLANAVTSRSSMTRYCCVDISRSAQYPSRGAGKTGQSVPGFDKSLDALLRSTPANRPMVPQEEIENSRIFPSVNMRITDW